MESRSEEMKAYLDTYKGSDDEAEKATQIAERDREYEELVKFTMWLQSKNAGAAVRKGLVYAYIEINGGVMYMNKVWNNYEIVTKIDNGRTDLGQVLWDIYQAEMNPLH